MTSIIIKKRTLTLVVLGLAGLVLLLLSWRGDLLKKDAPVPGAPVSAPVTGAVNFENGGRPVFEDNKTDVAGEGKAAGGESDFFVEYRLERERTRGQRVEWLREVINNDNSAAETRQKAQEHLMVISRNMAKEIELENLIRAKGYKDAAVLVDDRAATVIVAVKSLSAEEAARITGLVSRGTGVDSKNIVIITKS